MKLTVYFIFLLACFTIFSCSHNPYKDFQQIAVGDDKAVVLEKIGSPLRSSFKDSKNIWTYRFYSTDSDTFVYKDIILDNEKVLDIKDSKVVDIKEIERKEKLIEQSIKEDRAAPAPAATKPGKPEVDDSILTDTSKKKVDDFKPVD